MKIIICTLLLLLLAVPCLAVCENEWYVGLLGFTKTTTENGPVYHSYIPVSLGSNVDVCESLPLKKGCRTYLCDVTGSGTDCLSAVIGQCHLYRVSTCTLEVPTIRELLPLAVNNCLYRLIRQR